MDRRVEKRAFDRPFDPRIEMEGPFEETKGPPSRAAGLSMSNACLRRDRRSVLRPNGAFRPSRRPFEDEKRAYVRLASRSSVQRAGGSSGGSRRGGRRGISRRRAAGRGHSHRRLVVRGLVRRTACCQGGREGEKAAAGEQCRSSHGSPAYACPARAVTDFLTEGVVASVKDRTPRPVVAHNPWIFAMRGAASVLRRRHTAYAGNLQRCAPFGCLVPRRGGFAPRRWCLVPGRECLGRGRAASTRELTLPVGLVFAARVRPNAEGLVRDPPHTAPRIEPRSSNRPLPRRAFTAYLQACHAIAVGAGA